MTACEEDLPEILTIENASFSDPWTFQGFLDCLKYSYSTLLTCKADGRVAGYGCLYAFGEEGEIINVAIAPEFRGRGYGEKLVFELIHQGRIKGVSRFILDVRMSNASAIRLYEKAGFKTIAIEKNFYENPKEDAWLMELVCK